jgi:peptidoglycan/LPS O-acetylase OafA/YrhL
VKLALELNKPTHIPVDGGSTGLRFPELDMLRGLAISMVFAFHALDYAGIIRLTWDGYFRTFDGPISIVDTFLLPLKFGAAGVSIFFAVSGFCIHYFYRNLKSVIFFYTRRFLRILPPYWFLLVVVSALPFIGKELFDISLGVQFLSHLLLIHNFWDETIYGIAPAWWTIAVEIQLYLLYPFVLHVSKRYGWISALVLTGSLEFSLRAYEGSAVLLGYHPLPNWLSGSPLFFWLSWTLGAWAAERRILSRPVIMRREHHLTFAVLFLACYYFRLLANFNFTLVSFWTALVLCSSTAYPCKALWFRFLGSVGVISYSLYLVCDSVLFNTSMALDGMFTSKLLVLLVLLVSFGPAYLLANYIYSKLEKPSQELGRRIYRAADRSHKRYSFDLG